MQIQENFSLRRYNTFGIESTALYFSTFTNIDELAELVETARIFQSEKSADPLMILGGGSNILLTRDRNGYVLKNEINLAMERHRQNKTIVVPVWTRSCDFTNLRFSALQGLPSNGKAVDTYSNKDEAFTEIAVKLKNIVSNLKNPREILT